MVNWQPIWVRGKAGTSKYYWFQFEIEFNLANLRQEPGKYEVAEKVLQCNGDIFVQKLPNIDDLVNMATVISKKALHEFLLVKCKEQTIEFTKGFKVRGNTPKLIRTSDSYQRGW